MMSWANGLDFDTRRCDAKPLLALPQLGLSSYLYQKKNRHVRKGDSPEVGNQWVFAAIDAETKLVPAFHVG
jgi:hypothetical protein